MSVGAGLLATPHHRLSRKSWPLLIVGLRGRWRNERGRLRARLCKFRMWRQGVAASCWKLIPSLYYPSHCQCGCNNGQCSWNGTD
jgi:hypothetical protein